MNKADPRKAPDHKAPAAKAFTHFSSHTRHHGGWGRATLTRLNPWLTEV